MATRWAVGDGRVRAHAESDGEMIDAGWVRKTDELGHHVSKRHSAVYPGPDVVKISCRVHTHCRFPFARLAPLHLTVKSALSFLVLWTIIRYARRPRVRAYVIVIALPDGVIILNVIM